MLTDMAVAKTFEKPIEKVCLHTSSASFAYFICIAILFFIHRCIISYMLHMCLYIYNLLQVTSVNAGLKLALQIKKDKRSFEVICTNALCVIIFFALLLLLVLLLYNSL